MKKKVLIIDDEKDIGLLLKRVLETNHYEVNVAINLKEGADKLYLFKPSFIVLDINLPDGNGQDSISIFKAIHPEVKIILMSANNDHLSAIFQSVGAIAFMQKPFKLQDLLNILKTN